MSNHWQLPRVASKTIVPLLTMSPQLGPSYMPISPGPAPIGTVQFELPGQALPEPELKQPENGFAPIRAHQSGIAWFQWHSLTKSLSLCPRVYVSVMCPCCSFPESLCLCANVHVSLSPSVRVLFVPATVSVSESQSQRLSVPVSVHRCSISQVCVIKI